jgi:hypothetical protein
VLVAKLGRRDRCLLVGGADRRGGDGPAFNRRERNHDDSLAPLALQLDPILLQFGDQLAALAAGFPLRRDLPLVEFRRHLRTFFLDEIENDY